MEQKTTLVIGASLKAERYSNKAVCKLQENNIPVLALGNRIGEINGTPISKTFPSLEEIHTVSLYLSPKNQLPYYEKILQLKPNRVIFNPGTENAEFEALLKKNGIAIEEACTLVLLSTNAY